MCTPHFDFFPNQAGITLNQILFHGVLGHCGRLALRYIFNTSTDILTRPESIKANVSRDEEIFTSLPEGGGNLQKTCFSVHGDSPRNQCARSCCLLVPFQKHVTSTGPPTFPFPYIPQFWAVEVVLTKPRRIHSVTPGVSTAYLNTRYFQKRHRNS